MGSVNFNPFNNNWFNKPSTPFQPINLLTHFNSLKTQQNSPPFAAISNPFSRKPQKTAPEQPGHYRRMLDQFYWECETRPDLRHAPKVEKILNEDPIFEKKENPTQEEIEENDKWWAEFKESPVVQFLAQAEEIADKLNELELKENSAPFRSEDKKLWQAVPNVIGLDGRPMPRKAIKTKKESNDKFWDFARQFFFGLWGFRQRPYPPGKPIDAAQAIGYKKLEKRYYDFIMRSGGWFYRDRLGRSRGPMELIQLKTAWGAGIIDKHTFIWGEDMDEWAPIGMVYGLEKAIATWEVRLGAAATAFLHKLQKGIPPWVPLKGHEPKTYKQMQEEAYESKRRDLAVLEANDGVWSGVRTPSHALFLWASGSELTSILEADHMPNKYIPKDLRKELEKVIPGLRPWEVLSVEQAMDQITYGGEWYREPLGSYTTGPPYIADWNKDVMRLFEIFHDLSVQVYNKMERTVPGFRKVMENVEIDSAARETKREQKRAAQKRTEEEIALFGRVRSDDE
ncbi:protein TIC 56, chloroplastic [Nicotiana tabacum]|uniref:Protein TIC 56, chloroplastic n=1 Tax=Nicotiana tabacum TaxID=4097 RepID=A0A1S4CUB7_TOBAC|nr:PREDICTED: protein TIC 56, chloroplastic-like [Nicotiana tabacum]